MTASIHLPANIHLPPKLILFAALTAAICLVFIITRAFYNLYLHPLRKFPGRRSWIAFPVLRYIAEIRGNYDAQLRELHERYGEVVRVSAKELSFITAEAWKDIYGYGHRQLPKDLPNEPDRVPDIFRADDQNHTRIRRNLAHAFSDRALVQQEPIVKGYVDLLVKRLTEMSADNNQSIDIVKWYTLTTYDIIGDLAFGQSFSGLKNGAYHPWVSDAVFLSASIPILRFVTLYPFLLPIAKVLTPKDLVEKMNFHLKFARETVTKRLEKGTLEDRGDFMTAMLRNKDNENALSHEELVINADSLIMAGSDTTSTLLSGVTYWLLKTPDAMRKVVEEVRSTFKTEEEIGFLVAAQKLPYMLACLDEAFRMYPPIPTGVYRQTLPGVSRVSGHDLPPGTLVAVHQWSAYWSETNFHKPRSYIPERWLPESTQDPKSPFYNDNRAVLQPFNVGPRNCIGRNLAYHEMRIILARILWNFDLELDGPHENWWDTPTYTSWLKSPLMVKVKKRQDLVKA